MLCDPTNSGLVPLPLNARSFGALRQPQDDKREQIRFGTRFRQVMILVSPTSVA